MRTTSRSTDVIQRLDAVRRTNLAAVARIIDRLGVASQTAIVKETGLANGVAAGILAQLRDIGFASSVENVATGSVGRPRRGVRVDPMFAFAVGVEVTAESIAIQICGADGHAVANAYELTSAPPDETPRAMALDIFARYHELVRSVGLPDVPASMVISIPGLVYNRHLRVPPFGWVDGSIDEFARAAPLRVRHISVLNDGDAAVVAEAQLRPELECVAVLHGSDGLGGGVSLHGQLFSGAGGAAGQFGHVIVQQNGLPCYCGNDGCLRQYVSASAFARDLNEQEALTRSGSRGYALELSRRAEEGENAVLELLASAKGRLTQAVGILGAVLSPEIVVLTGNLAPLAPWLESSATSRTGRDEYRARWARPIDGSVLGTDSAVHGAVMAARAEILTDPAAFAAK